jgi:hydrogenase nickel incorporation protein HypA/HybF
VHELSLAGAVIDTAERHADGRRVTAVHLRVGHLRQVVPESLSFYFAHVARGTVCEDARLSLEVVPAQLRCHGCGHAWELTDAAFRCPACEGADVEIVAGEEFEVEWINVEQLEEQCTA